jgi:hypothetical protein
MDLVRDDQSLQVVDDRMRVILIRERTAGIGEHSEPQT